MFFNYLLEVLLDIREILDGSLVVFILEIEHRQIVTYLLCVVSNEGSN